MKLLMVFVPKWAITNSAILVALCVHTLPVSAHAMLLKAEPARRGVLTKAPTQVRLWFNEEIESAYTSLFVLDANKKPVTETKPHVVKDDPRSVVLPLPELLPGKYSVKFRVLSVDGHVVDSSFDYTVKNKSSAQEK
ncbi:MAG: copper resistance CopC family protein [Nitrosomonadaceae bacterium]|nr:copper resistance protein CopC [Nitrosomonadaceae bacterium]MDW7664042.1 copper resistance protein CopC [Nitrosomonadaceae bacterium]